MKRSIRVAVVEEAQEIQNLLELALFSDKDFVFTGSFSGERPMLRHMTGKFPDVVLLDAQLRGLSAMSWLRFLKKLSPDTKVILLAMLNPKTILIEALKAGADGCLVKPLHPTEIASAIRAVCDHGTPLSPCVARYLVQTFVLQPAQPISKAGLLTQREHQIMNFVAEGQIDRKIAQELHLQVSTVKRHLHNIYTKLGVRNRVEAINRISLKRGGK